MATPGLGLSGNLALSVSTSQGGTAVATANDILVCQASAGIVAANTASCISAPAPDADEFGAISIGQNGMVTGWGNTAQGSNSSDTVIEGLLA